MTVIERWECPEHGAAAFTSGLGPASAPKRWCDECQAYIVAAQVEYVPASQLQGAVEALRQVREEFADGRGGYDANDPVVRIVNAALDRLGGQ